MPDNLAKARGVTSEGLAKSYNGDWKSLIDSLTEAQLRTALKVLDEESLRAVVYGAFKFPVAERRRVIAMEGGVSKSVSVPSLFYKTARRGLQ